MAIQLLTVIPAYLHRVDLQWDLTGAEAAHSHTFVVERSGSPEGPWEAVSPILNNAIFWQDENAQLFDIDRDIYYRVRGVDTQAHVESVSNIRNMMGDFDRRRYLLWRKMNYDEQIMLKKFNGVPLKVLKRRHFGNRCPVCYDPASGMLTLSKCSTCKGTGWQYGYYAPIQTWGRITPTTNQTAETNNTSIPNISMTQCFLLNFPRVQHNDILVETLTNTRWRVETEQSTELIRVGVHQDITMSRIPRDAVEFAMSL